MGEIFVEFMSARESEYNRAGGKGKLVSEIEKQYPFEEWKITKYAEPFVSGGTTLVGAKLPNRDIIAIDVNYVEFYANFMSYIMKKEWRQAVWYQCNLM